AGGGGVVGSGGRGAVAGGVLHGHRLGGGLRQRDRHLAGGLAGLFLRVGDVHDVEHGRVVVVADGAGRGVVRDGRVDGAGQGQGEGLVVLVGGVVEQWHLDARGVLSCRHGRRPGRRGVVAAGGRGAVGRGVVDRDLVLARE